MKRAAFLDRDGVINYDLGYVGNWEQFIIIPGVIEACRALISQNYLIIVITNQSGIARGYYSLQEYLKLQQKIELFMAKRGVRITETFFCPHHPLSGYSKYRRNCVCRKPGIGMIEKAKKIYNLDLSKSLMFGDNITDQQAAFNAGIGTFIPIGSVLKGYKNLLQAVKFLLEDNKNENTNSF